MDKKVAIVTGGGSGIGKASALRLAEEGFRVGIMDVKEHRAMDVQDKIVSLGGEAMAIDLDVSDEQRVIAGLEEVNKHWGRLDVVFENAGINGTFAPIEELGAEEWEKTIQINLKGTFLMVKHSIPYLKQRGGSIVITSSVNGTRTFSNIGMSAYSTSKAGQAAFMKMAALELAAYKIRVNAICPGAIRTNIDQNTEKKGHLEEVEIPVEYPDGKQPLENGPGSPEQVADLVCYLVSEKASHVTGTEVFVDGAESLL
ncbi:SDR family oxidoreductase [Halobacillus salinarum]|uniref:SDR family oxidoreductase n=1 Tax=Halobacillus salinarum TaxID=2932257 RepID=A0ABY4EI95_9BACI|nr:SDR family NAD(P)-dependent oxidoreductase [Halobacillus salinarum]UOQ44167.1 SDR family oxidoreductase [Halobacillus salinarum]